jgi:predicted enzyme related to lactoylglutathione lyase
MKTKSTITFTDVGLISDDVLRLVEFYEKLFNVKADRVDEIDSGLHVGGLRLSITAARLDVIPQAFYYVSGKSSDNTLLGFDVDDVDAEYLRVLEIGAETLNEPTTHPWGARSFQFRDPDGNIINFRSHPGA